MSKGLLGIKDTAFIATKVLHEYAAVDADAAFRADRALDDYLERDGLQSYLGYPMMELSRCLLWSGLYGIKVDRSKAHKLAAQLGKVMETLEGQIFEYSGSEFNPRAPNQKVDFLFDTLGLPPFIFDENDKRIPMPVTKTGQYQCDKHTLKALFEAYRHPAIEHLLEYSGVNKLLTTYVHPGLTKWLDPNDRVHTTFKLGGAITGRVTSSEPPIATIPRDKEYNLLGKPTEISIRDLFIADRDHELTYADVSQAELCVLAVCAGEQSWIDAYRKGVDMHNHTAWTCLGIPYGKEVSKEKRIIAKCINFGLVYGGSPKGIAAQARCAVELVERAMQRFNDTNKNTYRYLNGVAFLAVSEGQLTSPFGRIRRFPGIDPRNKQKVASVGRMAKNFNCQSGASEAVFRMLIRLCRKFKKYKMKAWPVNMVYDSIITDHPKKERRDVRDIVIEEMTRPVKELDGFQFAIDIGQGPSWGEAERHADKIRP